MRHRYATAPYWLRTWWRFKEHRVAFVSLILLSVFYVTAIFCEPIAPGNPYQRNIDLSFAPPQRVRLFHEGGLRWPFVYPVVQHLDEQTQMPLYTLDRSRPLSLRLFPKGDPYRLWGVIPMSRHLVGLGEGEHLHLLGTDRLGRDLLSRIIYGGRISLSIGFVGVMLSLVLGIVLGGLSGYYGGWIDAVVQRSIEVLRSFPAIPLWLALSALIPATWSNIAVYFCMTCILAIIGWTELARVVRGKFLALREEDYVLAAKVCGVRERTIIRKHLVPAFSSHLIVHVTLAIPSMIMAETSLSFLRLGLRPPTISWGVLLQDAQNIVSLQLHPWLLAPAAFVVLTVLTFNFIGDGLRDAVDPNRA